MQDYFESEFISISYSKNNHCIIAVWKTPPTSEEFRKGMDHMLEAMINFKTGKIVADTIYMGTVHPDNQEWAASHWYTRAAKAGFSHNAIVVPSDIFTAMSVESILELVGNSVAVTQYFQNVNDALDWIKKF